MKISLFFFLFLSVNLVNAQIPSNCNLPDELRKHYESDVANLAIKWLYTIKSPDTVYIEIPTWCQDSVWSGLAAIYNRNDQVEIDSIFNKYCIHLLDGIAIWRNLVVFVDTTYSWTNSWSNLQTTTGISALDTIMAKYGFTVTGFYHTHYGNNLDHYAALTTSQSINERSFCDSLESFPGVNLAGSNGLGYMGSSPSIEFSETSNVKSYSFKLGWGDVNWHTWSYKVYPNCSIEFMGVTKYFNEPYPEPANCNILYAPAITNPSLQLKVYPNPVSEKILIEFSTEGHLSILNLNGQELLSQQITELKTQIDIIDLPVGLYFVRVINGTTVHFGKFIKQ